MTMSADRITLILFLILITGTVLLFYCFFVLNFILLFFDLVLRGRFCQSGIKFIFEFIFLQERM